MGVPLLVAGLDGALLVGYVADGGPCAHDCFAGLALSVVSPVATPLRVAMFESDAIVALTLGAVVLVLACSAVWWRAIVRVCCTVAESRAHPVAAFGGLWLLALVGTYLLSAVASGLDLMLHPLVALVVEAATWTLVVAVSARRAARRSTVQGPRPPPPGGADSPRSRW